MDTDPAVPEAEVDEVAALRDEIAQLQSVALGLGDVIDTMILVATQADDHKTQRLIDAALRRAGFLEEGESAFDVPPPAPTGVK